MLANYNLVEQPVQSIDFNENKTEKNNFYFGLKKIICKRMNTGSGVGCGVGSGVGSGVG